MSQVAGYVMVAVGALLSVGGGAIIGSSKFRKPKLSAPTLTKNDIHIDTHIEANKPPTLDENTLEATGTEAEPKEHIVSQPPPDTPKPRGVEAKYTVLGTKTRYLTERHIVHNPLHQLSTYLLKEAERDMFCQAVADIDNILCLQTLLSNGQTGSVAGIPGAAMSFNVRAQRLLLAIVDYSHETMPSKTKREQMFNVVADIVKILDDLLHNMHRALAAMGTDQIYKDPNDPDTKEH